MRNIENYYNKIRDATNVFTEFTVLEVIGRRNSAALQLNLSDIHALCKRSSIVVCGEVILDGVLDFIDNLVLVANGKHHNGDVANQ